MSYGCPATLDGSPIGGGVGYLGLAYPSDARYVVGTAAELKSALASVLSGQMVYIADGARVLWTPSDTTNQRGLAVKPGAILAAGRGRPGITPGIIERQVGDATYENLKYWMFQGGTNSDFIGLTIKGNQITQGASGQRWGAIYLGTNGEAANVEVYGFGTKAYGVELVLNAYIHHGYIHEVWGSGLGYGIDIGGLIDTPASAIIEGMHFKNLRHCVVGASGYAGYGRNSYIARYNYIDGVSTSSVFDQHGSDDAYQAGRDGSLEPAGENIEICYNTSIQTVEHFVNIRGEPYAGGKISVHNNWIYKTDQQAIIQQFSHTPGLMYNAYEGKAGHTGGPFRGMEALDNWWGSTPPPSDLRKMAVTVSVARRAQPAQAWGMNLDGLNFYREGLTPGGIGHGRYGYEYIKPTAQEMDYFKSKGMRTYRVGFLWERVQHSLYGALDSEDIGYLDDVVNAAVARGLQVSIVPFDYGRYYDVSTSQEYVLGSSQLPYNAFADLWAKLATHFKGRVWGYDLMNEPYGMTIGTLDGKQNWKQAAQSAINAIRQVDASTTIIVPGYEWSSAFSWPSQSDVLKTLVDPSNNLIYEAHQYFDADTTGTYSGGIPTSPLYPTNATRAQYLLSPFVGWLRANGKRGLIGEMGVPSDQFWLDVFQPGLDYIAASKDVLVSIQIHTAGPWWPDDYTMCLDPNQDGSDKPQMVLLSSYI